MARVPDTRGNGRAAGDHRLTRVLLVAAALCAACETPQSEKALDQPCATTLELGMAERAVEAQARSTHIINRAFKTKAGPLVLGEILPAAERLPQPTSGVIRLKSYIIDERAPMFVRVDRTDTVRVVLIAFPSATSYHLAVAQYSRGIGQPAIAVDTANSPPHWRSAQWQTREVFARLDSFAVDGRPQVCLGAFDARR